MKRFSRADQSPLSIWWWTVDRPMLLAVFMLIGFGVVLVSTASPPVAEHLNLNSFHFLIRHVVFLVPALGILLGVSLLNERTIWRLSVILFGACLMGLVFVLLTGSEIKGAQRWVRVFGISIQPSEFIKPVFAVLTARFMALQMQESQDKGTKFPGYAIAAGIYGAVIMLLLLQPDLGMSVIITAIWGAQIFLAGFPFRLMLALGGVGIIGLILAYFSFSHVQSRIDRFWDPAAGDTYQVERSLQAFKDGGFWGAGPGQGNVKLHLPDAHADFIFAVAGEELGLIFTMIIMALFLFIVMRGYSRLTRSDDLFTVLAVGGLLAMFALQAFVHMGSSLHLLPAKGMTLPFISYGGSSVLAMALSMGMILALTRKQEKSSISRGGLSTVSLNRGRLEKLKEAS